MQRYKGYERENENILFPFNFDFSKTTNGFCFEQEEKIDRQGNRTIIKRVKYSPKKEKNWWGEQLKKKL